MIDFEETNDLKARIKVFGIGGAGGNALNNMIQQNLGGVLFYAANTDAQALNSSLAPTKLQLGMRLTNGLGAGGDPQVGGDAAMEDQASLAEQLKDADMVFVTAGMGGGTGTGAAPVIAQLARESGALTVGIVTKPFTFEGRRRGQNAERGLEVLASCVDTLIVIPNDRLLDIADANMTMLDAFRVADQVLYDAVKSISDIIVTPGLINVDFADVKSIMLDRGRALMGTGTASGDGRAVEAAKMAISSPLLEDANIDGAMGILINITGGPDMTLQEVNEAATLIGDAAHPQANIIWGSVVDESMKDSVKITVVGTGFERTGAVQPVDEASEEIDIPDDEERKQVLELLEIANQVSVTESTRQPPVPTVATTHPPEPPKVVRSERKRRSPRIYNPFSEPSRSEYDTPTFARRRQVQTDPTPVVEQPQPTRNSWVDDDSEPTLF